MRAYSDSDPEDVYVRELARQVQGLPCSSCGSITGHFWHCEMFHKGLPVPPKPPCEGPCVHGYKMWQNSCHRCRLMHLGLKPYYHKDETTMEEVLGLDKPQRGRTVVWDKPQSDSQSFYSKARQQVNKELKPIEWTEQDHIHAHGLGIRLNEEELNKNDSSEKTKQLTIIESSGPMLKRSRNR